MDTRSKLLALAAFCSVLSIVLAYDSKCPVGCECDPSRVKLKCSGVLWQELKNQNALTSLLSLQQLDLSKNKIARLESSFINVPTLKKLVLSENKIRLIDEKAFSNLTALTTLDLSSNNIFNLSRAVLSPLVLLERLKLRANQLKTLGNDVFLDLKKLRMTDLSENPWHCDCSLIWITEWIKANEIKFQPPAKCHTPQIQFGHSLKKLDYECMNVAGLELEPSQDQVVFAGDSLLLRCRGDGNADRVKWMWHDIDPRERFTEVAVTERTFEDGGLVESYIRIDKLEPQHSGDWVCQQATGKNHSAAVSVLVLSETTKYCPSTISRDNKGVYFWPRTVLGHGVELPCVGERVGADPGTASYICSPEGHWQQLNTTACSYISKTTRILEQFVRDDLTAPHGDSITDKAKILLNLTSDIKSLSDPVDVIFVSQTVEKYCHYLEESDQLPETLADVIASMQSAPIHLLVMAESHGKACSRLRGSLEQILFSTPSFTSKKATLAAEVFTVEPDAFTGMACVWRQPTGTRDFHCITSPRAVLEAPGRDLLALVELPISLFSSTHLPVHKLFVVMFPNWRLFPDFRNANNEYRFSNVVGIKVGGLEGINLTEPIALMIAATPGVLTEAVRWDSELNTGSGGWTTDGCLSSQATRDHLLFHCYQLGYYTIRQTLGQSPMLGRTVWGIAALYSGSCVLLVCVFLTFATYVTCYGSIQMSRRAKHALLNIWFSTFILCFLFTFGVFATDDVKVCEGLGLALHYFSLSTLLWMVVAFNHMYKRLSRCASDHSSDDLPPGVPVQKPILGLYLVGWGIGLIVCGISGAVHLRDYAQPQFCFLGAGPALSAVLVPTGILVVILFIFSFLSFCAIRNNDLNGQNSEGTQGTENVDLELLEDGTACAGLTERRSAKSEVTDSEDIEDPEHSPIIQLKAHVIVLAMFLMLWVSAAAVTISDVYILMPHQEPVANCVYCIVAFCLGTFLLYFYCVARSDVRTRWSILCRVLGSPGRCCRSRSVSDTHASLPLQPQPPPVNNRPPSVNSGITGRSSSSHRTKAVLELNNCDTSDSMSMQCKPNCVNLVAMHRQMYRSNNSMPTYQEIANQNAANAFYNPRQSVVAKKFFKKQRRHRRNELGVRRRGDGGGTSEGEMSQCRRTWRPSAESAVFLSSDMENNSEKLAPHIFAYGSKINNTNIHIGHSSRKRDVNSPKDPNVLSEEDDDKNSEKQLLARLVIGAEEDSAAATVGPTSVDDDDTAAQAPDCRSVQLQCSLGDSSDTPEVDDSFCQKIDDLQLLSDDSCVEKLPSPPQYVTVLDPKYGVVKVTMNDYRQQSHRLSLASAGEFVPRVALASTPEECIEEENVETGDESCNNCEIESQPNISLRESTGRSDVHPTSLSLSLPRSSWSRSLPRDRNSPPTAVNVVANTFSSHRSKHRRSLPSSPDHHNLDHRRSLPSSPEGHSTYPRLDVLPTGVNYKRESPRLTLPPPPDFPATSDEGTVESEGDQHDLSDGSAEQWRKPEPPTSPSSHRSERPRPISDELLDRKKRLSLSPDSSLQEPKKETSV